MNLNAFADGTAPLDMTGSAEFQSLLQSAVDLGIRHAPRVRYVSRNIVARHLRFHLLEWGEPGAPPILLLHGGHQSAHSWDLVSLHLADRFHVIAVDQRGHGDSEWARDVSYSSEEMARDAQAVIAALGLTKPLVMGHSMGGRNSLLLALNAPEALRALVVVDIGPEISDIGKRVISSFVAANEEFEDLEQFTANVRRYDPYRSAEHIARTVKYNLFQRADGKYVSKNDGAPRRLGLLKSANAAERLTLDGVRDLRLPVLLVRGADSNVLSAEAAQRFVDALPAGRLVQVPDCGHNVHGQNTPGFIAAVTPFLDEALR
ncbi:MAG: alpha/beta fold hydrolase [Gammaproteobacteria bacterium]